ncbi:hypothetical protein D3C76_1384360 [compost metagenome]
MGVARNFLREARHAVIRRRRACSPLQLHNVNVLCGILVLVRQPLARLAAFLHEIGAEECDIQRGILGVHGAVCQNDGNSRVLRLLKYGIPARFDHRRERNHIDLLLNKGTDRLDLVLLLLLGVREFQRIAGFFCRILNGLGVRTTPAALRPNL